MSQDLTIKQITSVQDNIAIRKAPSYLVEFIDTKPKGEYFIATKYEEGSNCAKLTGFYSKKNQDTIVDGYDEIIKTTDKQKFVEMLVPWQRISCIRSLVFRQK